MPSTPAMWNTTSTPRQAAITACRSRRSARDYFDAQGIKLWTASPRDRANPIAAPTSCSATYSPRKPPAPVTNAFTKSPSGPLRGRRWVKQSAAPPRSLPAGLALLGPPYFRVAAMIHKSIIVQSPSSGQRASEGYGGRRRGAGG